MRRSLCPHCRKRLEPDQRIHPACIDGYAEALQAKADRVNARKARELAKLDRALTKQKKAALKTNGQKKAEAQRAINHWVVHVRDKDQPCISCGRFHEGAWHAGHFLSRGRAPHLALDPRNLAKQCAPCNLYLHGNLIEFRRGLIERHGEEFVLALEADQTPRHYSGDDYEEIKREYRAKVRELKRQEA